MALAGTCMRLAQVHVAGKEAIHYGRGAMCTWADCMRSPQIHVAGKEAKHYGRTKLCAFGPIVYDRPNYMLLGTKLIFCQAEATTLASMPLFYSCGVPTPYIPVSSSCYITGGHSAHLVCLPQGPNRPLSRAQSSRGSNGASPGWAPTLARVSVNPCQGLDIYRVLQLTSIGWNVSTSHSCFVLVVELSGGTGVVLITMAVEKTCSRS